MIFLLWMILCMAVKEVFLAWHTFSRAHFDPRDIWRTLQFIMYCLIFHFIRERVFFSSYHVNFEVRLRTNSALCCCSVVYVPIMLE